MYIRVDVPLLVLPRTVFPNLSLYPCYYCEYDYLLQLVISHFVFRLASPTMTTANDPVTPWWPIDMDLCRAPAGRTPIGDHPDFDRSIAVPLTNPGIWLHRNMTAQEFLRHNPRSFAARRFQAINKGLGGLYETYLPRT